MLRVIILISLLFLGCESQKVENRNSIFQKFNAQVTGKPVFALTMPYSNNEIQYIGYGGSLYHIREDSRTIPFEFFFQWSNPERREKYQTEGEQLEILVDESNVLGKKTFENFPQEYPENLSSEEMRNWFDSRVAIVPAFPVYIINRSTIASSFQFFDFTNSGMIQEAKDKNGTWRPIEYLTYGWCGNAHGDYLVPSNSYYVIAACKYRGDFDTELRIKLQKGDKVYYSNTYKGQINLSQFEMSEKLRKHDEWKKSWSNKTDD